MDAAVFLAHALPAAFADVQEVFNLFFFVVLNWSEAIASRILLKIILINLFGALARAIGWIYLLYCLLNDTVLITLYMYILLGRAKGLQRFVGAATGLPHGR